MSLVGQRVVVDGLVARPEHNGTQGAALSFDPVSGRYNILMDSTGGVLALKPQNLRCDAPWYYMGMNGTGAQGPLTAAALSRLYDAGDGVGDLTPVWSQSMQDWAPLSEAPLKYVPSASEAPILPPAPQGTTAPVYGTTAAAAAVARAATVAGVVAEPDGASVGQAATAAMQALQAQLRAILDEACGGPGAAKAEAVVEAVGRMLAGWAHQLQAALGGGGAGVGGAAVAALQALLRDLEPLMDEAQQQELCDNGGGEHGGSQACCHHSPALIARCTHAHPPTRAHTRLSPTHFTHPQYHPRHHPHPHLPPTSTPQPHTHTPGT